MLKPLRLKIIKVKPSPYVRFGYNDFTKSHPRKEQKFSRKIKTPT